VKYLRYFKESINSDRFNPSNIKNIIVKYLETALWLAPDDESEKDNFENMTIYNFSKEAYQQAENEIKWFLDVAGNAIERSNLNDQAVGFYLWLTRNGHGSGFWDHSYNNKEDEEELCYLSKILGECWIYIGDDNKIYFEGSDKYKKFDIQKYKEERELQKNANKYNL